MENIKLDVDERGVERVLRKFKRMCDNYGIVKRYRYMQEYKKPSIQAKEKSEAAEKRRRKTKIKTYRGRTKI